MKLYFAYGSNMNRSQMARRCPKAQPVGRYTMPDAKLVFRGVADCIHSPGDTCEGALWIITEECERALDRYEGFTPDQRGMYRKEHVEIAEWEGFTKIMLYSMNSTGIFPPSSGYLQGIIDGYRDFAVPIKSLREAVIASYDDKAPSHIERQRYRRTGRPPLARDRRGESEAPKEKPAKPKGKAKAKPAQRELPLKQEKTGSAIARKNTMVVYGD